MSETTPHRIDPPSAAVPARVGQHGAGPESRTRPAIGAVPSDGTSDRIDKENLGSDPIDSPDHSPLRYNPAAQERYNPAAQEEWLRLHATDLIQRLQAWACDLDAREAQLNSRTSIQEHRERRFRLRQHDRATELAEQQRSVERLRRDLESQARRLAFQNEAG